jgi:hypothetical protein
VRLAAVDFTLISNQAELAVTGVDQGFSHPMHMTFMLHAIANQLGYGQQLEIVRGAELDQVGNPRHGPVVPHDFADHPRRHKSSQSCQVDRGFRLAGAH